MEVLAALLKDVYKAFHPFAYNPKVQGVFSNFTNRFGKHSNILDNQEVMAVGMQYVVLEFLKGSWDKFFAMSKDDVVVEYKRVVEGTLGKEVSTDHIEKLHDLGYLPVEVRAVDEGTLVPYGVPNLTVMSTVDDFGWVTNMLETQISAMLWPIQTAATTAFNYRKRFEQEPSLDKEAIKFMGHDFSYRGDMGSEAAAMVGFGHLCSFYGSDSFIAGLFAEKYYGASFSKELVMASVDATEHSVMCSYTKNREFESLKHLMTEVSPKGILSIVSDTWDFWSLVTEYLPLLKETIMERDGKVVIRPDSGDPVDILCGTGVLYAKSIDPLTAKVMDNTGDKYVTTGDGTFFTKTKDKKLTGFKWVQCELPNENKGLIECLWDLFGGTVCEETGLKKLDPHIGAIYGDSITLERQDQIIKRLVDKGFCPEVVLGIGSFTYQYVTRDTHGSAVKATAVKVDGEWLPIQKDPKTDSTKKSAAGLIKVVDKGTGLFAVDGVSLEDFESEDNLLKVIFKDGEVKSFTTLAAIREKIDSYFS